MNPLQCLFTREGLPSWGLPATLEAAYGGPFGLSRPELIANFVASTDGVVTLSGGGDSGPRVSGDDEPDRFIMGLLRASVDGVLIGAGTFRAAAGARWHPETVYPQAAEAYVELRIKQGLRPHPLLVVVTGTGHLDTDQPACRDCLILTTAQGEKQLRGSLPDGAQVAVLGERKIHGREMLDFLHARGLQTILVEGGPTLAGQLFQEGLVDELFLTSSPRLFGRYLGDQRKSLVEGVDLGGGAMELASLRRHESHLYLRFTL